MDSGMSSAEKMRPAVSVTEFPQVPLAVEGASILHQMFRLRSSWRELPVSERKAIAGEAAAHLARLESLPDASARSAVYSILGHKADLLFLHFRRDFPALQQAELGIADLRLFPHLEPVSSYLSVVELGLYESTLKLHRSLADRGVEPHSAEWNAAVEEVLAAQRKAMAPRLFPSIPDSRYLCFYPMDRRRGEDKNWYRLPMDERGRQMHEHGMVGRRYAGEVRQIISSSIGFDDWEWGVDLFADDPLIFKQLIYEMRFDEVSAVYAIFGPFLIGLRCGAAALPALLAGDVATE